HRGYAGLERYLEDNRKLFEKYRNAAGPLGVPVIPTVLPGYNDRGIRGRFNHAMPRRMRPEAPEGSFFAKGLEELALPLATQNALRMLFITSWNEWNEDTAIEPLAVSTATSTDSSPEGDRYTQGFPYEGYGLTYLRVLQDHVVAVAGRLVSPNATAVADVRLFLTREGRQEASAVSDSAGWFRFSRGEVSPGEYSLTNEEGVVLVESLRVKAKSVATELGDVKRP
ncbi:MAG: hypothetical protein KDD44_08605, partial [Bdellovibrionales bacterium]|nr:hypothetical protein [Bdellovibrionales bacterium]